VTIDKAGQYQVATNIQDRHTVRQRSRGVVAEGCDTPASDPDIYQAPIGEPAMGVRRGAVGRSSVWFRSGSLAHGPCIMNQRACHLDLKFG
jgi:hypothetical protein